MSVINLHLGDCMEALEAMQDKQYDLAIVDPPYGIGVNKMTLGNGKGKIYRGNSNWDEKSPDKKYFDNILIKSKNQIIWGANHFISKIAIDSSCWIFWDKGTGDNDFADGELAWCSFKTTVRKYFQSWVGNNAKDGLYKERTHPTQKPVALYKWLLKNYAKQGDKILDTHGGSMSIAIACGEMGFDLDLWELDEEYFDKGVERVERHFRQSSMFQERPTINIIK